MKYLLFPVLLITVLFSCNEKVLSSGQDYLKIKDAFTQIEIPGQSDAPKRDYLKLSLDIKNPETTKVTEVIFRNRTYVVNSSRKDLRLAIGSGDIAKKKETLADNEAMIIYKVGDKNFVLTVRNIVAKPPIYLP